MDDLMFYMNWGAFLFYTVGAIGGVVYLIELAHDYSRSRRVRNDCRDDDPVENIVHLHPPREAPISARHK